jgi:hypothetical protein
MDPFKAIFAMLLSPKELVDPSPKVQRLEYRLNGEVFDFSTLSSGEREVVNIAFDFQLRRPHDCIVFFDEPELHLHPELSYKLITTLREIGERNQFILSTHSPDVITSSLDQSVIFLSPPRQNDAGESQNQAIAVSESDETHQALRHLGQSIGIIALGKRIVLIEGTESSLDKQTYGSIVGNRFPGLVLVPSGGKHTIESFDVIYESVLSKTIWGVEFFMLCDRDSTPPSSEEERSAISSGRLRLLPGYHLENEFLNEQVWAEAFADMEIQGPWLRDPPQILAALKQIALEVVPFATALTVSHVVRQLVGAIDIMPKGSNGCSLDELQALFSIKVASEQERTRVALDSSTVDGLIATTYAELIASISDPEGDWRKIIPGKPLLSGLASRAGIKPGRAKTLYISAASRSKENPFALIKSIFDGFAGSSSAQ